MIKSNTTIPFETTTEFKTTRDDQEMLKFVVLQGVSDRANENDFVGKFTLNEIPKGPKGQMVEVKMKCDVNSLFFCTATVVNSEGVTAQLITQREGLNLTRETREEARARVAKRF